MQASVIAHCDWGKDPRKRWMAVATRQRDGWTLHAPEPVGPCASLVARLQARRSGPVLIGVDFPIGVPRDYGARTGSADFAALLARLRRGDCPDWFTPCTSPDQISIQRPFYPQRPGGAARAHLEAGLGLTWQQLFRRCDRKTATRPAAEALFWTLGGKQVGKAAIAGWQELLFATEFSIWPFDGDLGSLLNRDRPVLTETYPTEAGARLGIRPGFGKRNPVARRAQAPILRDWARQRGHAIDPALLDALAAGFGHDAFGEDRFDAVLGLSAMLDVVTGALAEGAPQGDPGLAWEGWILGQVPDL